MRKEKLIVTKMKLKVLKSMVLIIKYMAQVKKNIRPWEHGEIMIQFPKNILLSETARTAAKGYVPNFASEDVDGDGTVTRNDPFIKKLMDSAKKFSPVAKELTNNIIGNLLNMPEGVDLFEIIEQLKFAQKAQEPEIELNRIKAEARLKRKNEKREEF